jgi:acyl-CoA reductase-like NAD-dependent aldehyde dehydrogenase
MSNVEPLRPSLPVSPREAALASARHVAAQVVVDGKLQAPPGARTFPVENPGDESIVSEAARCSAYDVAWAVESAGRAFADWSRRPGRERGDLLRRAADRLEAHSEELARLLALETGNALATQARPELAGTLEMLRLFAGLGHELKGRTLPWEADTLAYVAREPLGVVGAIIPWNAPLLLWAAKIGPALVAGNTVVIKSAEQAPLAVTRATELLQEVLPPGVLNAVSGFGEEAGQPLAEHPDVRKVTFTGSAAVGKQILHYAADKLCPVTLELGGKSPNVIMDDADLDKVIPGVIVGMRFTRQGQSCSAGTRIYIHEKVYDEVVSRTAAELAKLRVGDPLDEQSQMGAIISREQFERVTRYVEMARETKGVNIVCGGTRAPHMAKGYYFTPTLIEGVPEHSPVCRDEIFGPVAILYRFREFDDLLRMANDTDYGLAGAIWTRDLRRALAFANRLQAGFVQVNQYIGPRAGLSYGGYKMSGLGREYSLEAMLEHFTTTKTVVVNYAE